jgi:hypothetical protein
VKVKLDENLGAMGAVFLKAAGFDVATVAGQNLLSTPDADLAGICTTEGRCLITLDRDFSEPLRYPPSRYAGIIVVRLPGRFRLPLLERALALVVEASKQADVRGRLWIAQVDRIREYQERLE